MLRRDISMLALGLLLAAQLSFASYGVRVVRGIASLTHSQLSFVAHAGR